MSFDHSKQASIFPFEDHVPVVDPTVFVAGNAVVLGDVTIGEASSIWFGCVLRGDVGPIRIGARSNIQDHCVVHTTGGVSEVHVGDEVTVGHGCILHGCRIADRVLVGMGSTVLDLVEVGEESVIAAGTLLTARTVIPARSLVMGRPGKVIRAVTDKERDMGRAGATRYVELARRIRG